jgi:hypothetical protein
MISIQQQHIATAMRVRSSCVGWQLSPPQQRSTAANHVRWLLFQLKVSSAYVLSII